MRLMNLQAGCPEVDYPEELKRLVLDKSEPEEVETAWPKVNPHLRKEDPTE